MLYDPFICCLGSQYPFKHCSLTTLFPSPLLLIRKRSPEGKESTFLLFKKSIQMSLLNPNRNDNYASFPQLLGSQSSFSLKLLKSFSERILSL